VAGDQAQLHVAAIAWHGIESWLNCRLEAR
jgi:hypothetical protein